VCAAVAPALQLSFGDIFPTVRGTAGDGRQGTLSVTSSTQQPSQKSRYTAWRRWVYLPQSLPFRKALFQIHLWLGIAIGLYVCMISVTGSAAVLYRDLKVTPWAIANHEASHVLEWIVDLHENLLAGPAGREINGLAALVVVVLVLAGLVIWWPGQARWRRSLVISRPAKTHRFSWHLHSAIGIWSIVLLFGWAITGVYFAFPEPVERVFTFSVLNPAGLERPGAGLLQVLIRLHFGHFGGLAVQMVWIVLGLIPTLLFITGFVVWWKRVIVRSRQIRRSVLTSASPTVIISNNAVADPSRRRVTNQPP